MRLPLLLAVVLLAACDAAPDNGGSLDLAGGPVVPDTQTVDGVLVMRHDADAFARAPMWTLDSVPLVVIDGGEEFDLTWAYPPLPVSDGRFVVVNGIGGGSAMLFGSDGKPERMLALGGNGPGELRAPTRPLRIAGDTIYLADGANNSANWYTADRGVVQTMPLATPARVMCYQPSGRLPSGRLVAWGGCSFDRMEDGSVRAETQLVAFDPDYGRFDTLAMVPGYEMQMVETRYRGDRRMSPRLVRYGRALTIAAVDSTIVVASGADGYVLDLRAPDGRSTRRIVVDGPRRPVTQELRQAMIEQELAAIEEPGMEARVDVDEDRRLARDAPMADSLPPYWQVIAGDEGLLWVVDYPTPLDTTWAATAFRMDGVIVARVGGPSRGGGPVWFGHDRVMLREVDGDGVVRFGVYSIVSDAQ